MSVIWLVTQIDYTNFEQSWQLADSTTKQPQKQQSKLPGDTFARQIHNALVSTLDRSKIT